MKNKILIIFIILIILLAGITIGFKIMDNENNDIENNIRENIDVTENVDTKEPPHPIDVPGDQNVRINSDGVKENTSSQLLEEQNINGIIINNIKLTYVNGESTIIADLKNDTGKDIQELGLVYIKVKDETGTVVREMSVYVMSVKSGETIKINAGITSEIVNASQLEFSI